MENLTQGGKGSAPPAGSRLRRWSDDEVRKLRRLAGSMPIADIARELGRTVGSVKHLAYYRRIRLQQFGQNNPRHKYPDLLVAAARERFEEGVSPTRIAHEWGLSRAVVWNWCNEASRRHDHFRAATKMVRSEMRPENDQADTRRQ